MTSNLFFPPLNYLFQSNQVLCVLYEMLHTYTIVCLAVLLLSSQWGATANKGKLVQLTVLNRHGHRAPNTPFWSICPADRVKRSKFHALPGGLTELGFQEEFAFGKFLHKKYGDFIGHEYSAGEHYVRAVGEPRTLQSAMAVTQGCFPRGYGPKGMAPGRPQFVPVFSDLEGHEYLMDDVPCTAQAAEDGAKFLSTTGKAILQEAESQRVLREAKDLCETDDAQFSKAKSSIKDLVDGLIFSKDAGIGIGKKNEQLSDSTMFKLRNLSNTLLQGRLYGTDRQKTYTAVNFPNELLHHFELVTKNLNRSSNLNDVGVPDWSTFEKFTLYVAHREELYGVGHFFNIPVDFPPLPMGEMPTATSLLFALYSHPATKSSDKPDFRVHVSTWTPRNGQVTVKPTACASHLCTLDEFQQIYDRRVQRTSTWDQICRFQVPKSDFDPVVNRGL